MRNNLNVYWFIRVSSTIDNKKENLVCINCGHFHSAFHWFGHKHIFVHGVRFAISFNKSIQFCSIFFYHREKDIKLVLQFIDFTGRVTKCYQWRRRLIALSFSTQPNLVIWFELKIHTFRSRYIYNVLTINEFKELLKQERKME